MAARAGNTWSANRRLTPLERFAQKCAFDPTTGCVMWTGGITMGRGHGEPYGTFWFEGARWFAHRWSAMHIHGHNITNLQVDHCCPHGPATLCVEHVQPETSAINRLLQNTRPGRASQSIDTRRYWVFVQKGIEPVEERPRLLSDIPSYEPPAWLLPFLPVDAFPKITLDIPF